MSGFEISLIPADRRCNCHKIECLATPRVVLRIGDPEGISFPGAIYDDGHDDNVGRDDGGNGACLPYHPCVRGAWHRRIH
jgi:hypothetical protein